MKTLVMGIGNVLLRDEGVGVHALELLSGCIEDSDNIDLIDAGTLSFSLAGAVGGSDRLIVVDAAQLGAPAGTVRTYVDGEMDEFLGNCKRTVHEVGLLDLMDMARLTGDLPDKRALIGIQPAELDWGENLSPEVQHSLPLIGEEFSRLIASWDQ